jgi:hypothetical protein
MTMLLGGGRASRLVRALAAGAVGVAGALAFSTPAAADMVNPAGACVGTAAWKTAAFDEVSTDLVPDDVIEVPRADSVSWTGKVVGPAAATERQVSGRIAIALPFPFGSFAIDDWSGPSTDLERAGTYDYDLPSLVPAGVELDLLAHHDEGGSRHCNAAVGLMIEGGPFDSPLIWAALAGLLIFAGLLALLGRGSGGGGKIVGGALLGLPFGVFLALTLVLFGLLPLASPLVTALVVVGVIVGALWTWWSPLGSKVVPPA